jgi:hypothetical protein
MSRAATSPNPDTTRYRWLAPVGTAHGSSWIRSRLDVCDGGEIGIQGSGFGDL